ncbi:19666_t:CDS:2 [Gigaspora margarita]|uniref:19666_t:CDS:1 n=1 Tax=Gigaspora margarita TaxID=4874 RepID=A0ABN7VVS9_GIGMA|nr:19666_t:CDS:2 [Gigaspora margarita]
MEDNNRRDAKIEDTTDRVAKLEQKQLQNDNIPSNNSSNFNFVADYHDKPLEDKKMDTFLDEAHKKRISNEIRERRREKKLLQTNNTFTSQIEDLSSVNASKLPGDLEIYSSNHDQNSESTILNNSNNEELKQQLSTSIPTPIISDRLQDQDTSSVTAESIVYAFYKAIRRDTLLVQYYFIEKYDKKIDEIVISGVKGKTATSMVYQEIKLLLPDITDVNLRQKILRARKFYKLFNTLGIEKIKLV